MTYTLRLPVEPPMHSSVYVYNGSPVQPLCFVRLYPLSWSEVRSNALHGPPREWAELVADAMRVDGRIEVEAVENEVPTGGDFVERFATPSLISEEGTR